jgi:sarcosine oxidase delta subunit
MSKRSNSHFDEVPIKPKKAIKYQKRDYERFEDKEKEMEDLAKGQAKHEKKTKKSKQDIQDFSEFFQIRSNSDLKLYNYLDTTKELEPVFNLTTRQQDERTRGITMDFSDLISYLFDDYVLDSYIEFNVTKTDKLPHLMYDPNQGNVICLCYYYHLFVLGFTSFLNFVLILNI